MVNLAGALVLNLGTLSDSWVHSMLKAARHAKYLNVPIVLDPVGAGATPYRTETNARLIDAATPTIVRGNASEIRALAAAPQGEDVVIKGVDSLHTSESALDAAHKLSEALNCVVCISGAVDYCVQRDQVFQVQNGHPLMSRVTGLGCTASALCGAFAAVNPLPLQAAVHAMAVMGIAGELAAAKASGPGTLQLYFLDALHNLSKDQIANHLRLGD